MFLDSASVVSSADRLESTIILRYADISVLDQKRRVFVVGVHSTMPVDRPHEPEAGIVDIIRNVAPAGGTSAKDVTSLGRAASLGSALSVIYRTTLQKAHQLPAACTRHVHPSIRLLSAVRNHPEIAASAVEHCNMRYTRRRISLFRDLRCQSRSWGYESLLLSEPYGCVIQTGSAATSRSKAQRFSSSAMAFSISPLRHLPVFVVVLLA